MQDDTVDLKSAMYNGSDVKTVISTNVQSSNREIDIGGDYVFYTSNTKILRVHKSSGQNPTTVHTETTQIYGLLFYNQEGKNILTYIINYMHKIMFTVHHYHHRRHNFTSNIGNMLTQSQKY